MELQEPFKIYTAANNVEAHMIVAMLEAEGIPAFADEDKSVATLWAFGIIHQFHQPNIWIEKSHAEKAAGLILRVEEEKRACAHSNADGEEVEVECEECGKKLSFPGNLDGTTQECPHCGAYVDVGTIDWEDDVMEAEG